MMMSIMTNPRNKKTERNKKLLAYLKAGHTIREACRKFRLRSTGTISSILKRARKAKDSR